MSAYTLYIHPRALQEIKNLPGHVRQRAIRAVDALAEQSRPSGSVELSAVATPKSKMTLHRLRIDKWRVIYSVDEEDKVAVRGGCEN